MKIWKGSTGRVATPTGGWLPVHLVGFWGYGLGLSVCKPQWLPVRTSTERSCRTLEPRQFVTHFSKPTVDDRQVCRASMTRDSEQKQKTIPQINERHSIETRPLFILRNQHLEERIQADCFHIFGQVGCRLTQLRCHSRHVWMKCQPWQMWIEQLQHRTHCSTRRFKARMIMRYSFCVSLSLSFYLFPLSLSIHFSERL
eukprot:COSAG02_NODE_6511_length_3526_cov_16.997374_1_plen_199_part_00